MKEMKPEQENRGDEFDTEGERTCGEVKRTQRCMQVVNLFDRGLLKTAGHCKG